MLQAETKKYVIGGLQFELATNQTLRTRAKINVYVEKIPNVANKEAKGLTYKETLEFYSLILKRTKQTLVEKIVPNVLLNWFYKNRFDKMNEELQMEITADFFLRRINLRINGITRDQS